MKQLKRKILGVLCALLGLLGFMVSFFAVFMEANSLEEEIRSDLIRISSSMNGLYDEYLQGKPYFYGDTPGEGRGSLRMDDDFALITDEPVFTLQLSLDDSIRNILYLNADLDEISKAVSFASSVMAEHQPSDGEFGIHLFGSKYAWYYPNGRSISLMDLSEIQSRFYRYILACLILLIVYLSAMAGVSVLLCRWLIKPVEEAFDKQKMFIADASHELKTPLAVILSSAEAMERNPDPKWLRNIELESERMNRLISDLLELTRSEQTKLTLNAVDLSFVAERECLVQEARIYEKGLSLQTQIPENMMALANAQAAGQVISILLDNAISHAKSEIRVSLQNRGGHVLVQVANNGKPIPPQMQKRIFERFVREDQSRTRSENRFGLGLAIAKALMEQSQGSIQVQTIDGLTVFTAAFRQTRNAG